MILTLIQRILLGCVSVEKQTFWPRNFLIGRVAQATEAEVFAELYCAHTYAVFNYCLFRVNDSAVAEDLTADTFERAWRARSSYRPDQANFNTWLFTICRHIVTDWQRRQQRRQLTPLDEQHVDSRPSPEAQVTALEQQQQLRCLLQALDPDDQELIALKFGAGLTNRHIAQLTGKSETAVGSALYRIMQKLRTRWED